MIEMNACNLCPRECGVNRKQGELGYCHMTNKLSVARAALHMWEEPCISGKEGAGAVFFSGCTMGCVYCQNHSIADGTIGKIITIERLAQIFLELQGKGANTINLVTPTHFLIPIIQALDIAKKNGLHLPIVYNTSGYEKVEALQRLEGYVDVYLPDFKYYDGKVAFRYSKAKNYADYAKKAVCEMLRQTGTPRFNEKGIMTKGVIVRHLVLPGQVKDSKRIIDYLYHTFGDKIYLSIMNQYTPLPHVSKYKELNRTITEEEYEEVVDYAIELGVENGFIQEGETAKESFIPEFDYQGV